MAFSMDAARLAPTQTVCDVCAATSSSARGAACRTCAVGTMRYRSELDVLREQRRRERRAARAQALRP
jgi:hypothetical protein